jgi:hypothetical protein
MAEMQIGRRRIESGLNPQWTAKGKPPFKLADREDIHRTAANAL